MPNLKTSENITEFRTNLEAPNLVRTLSVVSVVETTPVELDDRSAAGDEPQGRWWPLVDWVEAGCGTPGPD